MKTNYIIKIFMASALLLSSCSDDLRLQSTEQALQKGESVQIGVSLGGDESRLAFNEGDEKVTLTWEEGDGLKVINASQNYSLTDFTLKSGENTAFGVFEGTPETAYVEGNKLYALFHNDLADTDLNSDRNVVITLKNQDGKLDDNHHLMYGETTYTSSTGLPSMNLEHLTTIIKVTIPTTKTLTKLVLEDGGTYSNHLRSKATLVVGKNPSDKHEFVAGDLVYCYDDDVTESNDQIIVQGTFEPDVNGEVNVYFYVLPVTLYAEYSDTPYIYPSLTVTDSEGKEYINAEMFDQKTIKSGKMYRLNTGIFSIVPFAGGDGTETSPYQIATRDQLYSFMLLCSENDEYKSYHYKMTSDIELDGSVFWRPFNFYGTFDGGNHTISGIKENWLFDEVYGGAKIRNIKMNVTPEIAKTGRSWYGVLASRVAGNGTEVVNCHNIGNIKVDFYNQYGGALVGLLEQDAKMTGCSNTGNFTLPIAESVGGLVGCISSGASMIACYSTGTITLTDDWKECYIGGLVGSIVPNTSEEFTGKSQMISCWTSMNISVTNSNENIHIGDVTASGSLESEYVRCYKVETVPTAEQISKMNAAITSGEYKFGENGAIVAETSTETE